MKDSSCPFCQDAVTKAVFMSSANCRVIYNKAPILPGHSLVIPADHYESALDMPPPLAHELFALSLQAAQGLMKVFNANGFDWTIQDGAAAGQTVPHVHLHLIPRFKDDLPNPGDWYPELMRLNETVIDSARRPAYSDEELADIAAKIKERLQNGTGGADDYFFCDPKHR